MELAAQGKRQVEKPSSLTLVKSHLHSEERCPAASGQLPRLQQHVSAACDGAPRRDPIGSSPRDLLTLGGCVHGAQGEAPSEPSVSSGNGGQDSPALHRCWGGSGHRSPPIGSPQPYGRGSQVASEWRHWGTPGPHVSSVCHWSRGASLVCERREGTRQRGRGRGDARVSRSFL